MSVSRNRLAIYNTKPQLLQSLRNMTPISSTLFTIGDLQGCHQSLLDLLKRIDATTPGARLVFVGDLVNRGPQSLATLRLIRSLGDRAQAVLGNHDLHLLAAAHGIRKLEQYLKERS